MYSLHYVTYISGHKVITNQNQYGATSVCFPLLPDAETLMILHENKERLFFTSILFLVAHKNFTLS